MVKIAILGSGSGTNAENIIRFYQNREDVEVALLIANTPKSRFSEIAEENGIPYALLENDVFASNPEKVIEVLKVYKVEWIILAGFLRKIDPLIIQTYRDKMINLHPSLLPKHGGKGMYGMKVHQAVLDQGDEESGITVHFVNENFDEGRIIEQKKVNVKDCQEADEIRARVQALEQEFFPSIIDSVIH